MTDNIFADQQTLTVEDLVGPGKKYADANELAKAYVNADKHIQTLTDENGQFREGIQQNLQNLQNRQQENTPPPAPTGQNANQEADLGDRIRDAMRQERESEKLTTNVEAVSQRLTEVYGSPEAANAAVKAKAQELGVSLKFLMDSAAHSPKAFYATVGLDTPARNAPGPRGDMNPEALNALNPSRNAQAGTYKYYEELRKTNKKLYDSPKIQLEMHNQAMLKGEAFFA